MHVLSKCLFWDERNRGKEVCFTWSTAGCGCPPHLSKYKSMRGQFVSELESWRQCRNANKRKVEWNTRRTSNERAIRHVNRRRNEWEDNNIRDDVKQFREFLEMNKWKGPEFRKTIEQEMNDRSVKNGNIKDMDHVDRNAGSRCDVPCDDLSVGTISVEQVGLGTIVDGRTDEVMNYLKFLKDYVSTPGPHDVWEYEDERSNVERYRWVWSHVLTSTETTQSCWA